MPDFPRNLANIAMYLRKSRADIESESRGEGETLSRHRTALLSLAEKCRYGIRDTYEEIVSGERILDRPEMQRLLHNVQAGSYTAVMCMDLDRLGRGNMVDQGLIQEAFKTSNTLIITPRKVYDLQDELDEEWSEFEAFMARRELKIITRRLQRGRKQSASLGKSISKKPPFGYLRDESLRLYPDPDTAPVVKMIFHLASDGYGMTKIAKQLTSVGIPTPMGKAVWERSSVYAILKNPVYLGQIVWGRMKYNKSNRGGSTYERVRQTEDNWIVTQNAHEPLVDKETYDRYLMKLDQRPKVPVTKELANPLATLVYCSECGKSMRRQPTYNRPHNRLLCLTIGCPTKSSSFEIVEERILQELQAVLGRLQIDVNVGNLPRRTDNGMLETTHKRITDIEQSIKELVDQRNTLHDLLEKKIYDVETYLERNRVLGERLSEAEEELRKLRIIVVELEHENTKNSFFLPRLTGVIESYQLADNPESKNKLMKSVVRKIVYLRKANWNKQDQFELEISLRL
jgi:site-specific DNA recombinase